MASVFKAFTYKIDEYFESKNLDANLKEEFITKISQSGKYFFEISPLNKNNVIKKHPKPFEYWIMIIAAIITAIATGALAIKEMLK